MSATAGPILEWMSLPAREECRVLMYCIPWVGMLLVCQLKTTLLKWVFTRRWLPKKIPTTIKSNLTCWGFHLIGQEKLIPLTQNIINGPSGFLLNYLNKG